MYESTEDMVNKLHRTTSIVHNSATVWVVLLISIVLTLLAYWLSSSQIQIRAEERFNLRAEEVVSAINERMALYEQALWGGAGFFNASKHVDRDEWRTYVESLGLSKRLPGFQGFGYAEVISDKAQHVAEIRAQGYPEYSLKPEGERDFYTSIVYLEPFDWRNQRAFGYDMWSNPLRRKAMQRARDQGALATSGMITLVQETEKDIQKGFLTYMPIYKSKSIPQALEQRQDDLQGWVYAAFRAGDLMNGVLGGAFSDITFDIYDGSHKKSGSLLFSSANQTALDILSGGSLLTTKKTMVLQGREWCIYFSTSSNRMLSRFEARQSLYILVVGLIIVCLLFYVLLSLFFVNRHIKSARARLQQEFEVNQQSLLMQTRLIESAERESETFFQMAPEAFLVVSKAGIIVRANKYAHDLFGYTEHKLLDTYLEELVPDSIKKEHVNMRFEYFQKPTSRAMGGKRILMAKKKDGTSFSTTINLEPIEFRGEMHVVAAVHDVSGQKELEKRMAEAKEKAESASRSKSDFVANMSHEIRTPLNAVIGAAQLLGKTDPDTAQIKYINMIRSSGEALLGVINDILDFSKVEAGCMELSLTPFNLSEVLSRVSVMMSMNVGEKDIELVVHVDLDVRDQLIGDPLRLQQVLINLASNAIKFTDKGTVLLSVSSLGCEDGLQKLKFAVSDTGIGMNDEQRSRLFNAFTQADESITRRFGGTGLGLVISNRIVEMMGTQIKVSSTPEEGTVFRFSVELAVDESCEESNDQEFETGYKVLMIDDSSDSCAAVKEVLSSWGWGLWCYHSWSEAESALSGAPLLGELDFVLLDWKIPEDGHEITLTGDFILERLQKMGLKSGCSSVLLNSNSQCASLLMDSMQKQFDAGLVKPMLKGSLLDTLSEALVKRTGQSLVSLKNDEEQLVGRINGVRILLVEDNIFNQTIAEGLLEDMGAKVEVVNNGKEAVDFYANHPNDIDIIFMDIQMPVMDGLSATKVLRRDMNCQLPIIAMTAGVLQSERDRYLSEGMNDFVPKPIDENELFTAIHRGLKVVGNRTSEAKSVKSVTKPPIEAPLVFNSQRLELLSKGKSNRVKSIIDSIDSMALNGEQSLDAGWLAIKANTRDQAHILFHGFKGQVANYGGEVLAAGIQTLEQGLRDNLTVKELKPLYRSVIKSFHEYILLAQKWKEEQKKLFEEE